MSTKEYDDRIVRMGFDNAKFESGAAKTMSTLDKLNDKLKLKGAVEGSDNVQKEISSIDFSSLERAISRIESRFSTMGIVGMNVINKITDGIAGSVKQLEAATIGQIKSGGWSRAMNIANAKFQIEGLGFAWEEVEKAVSYGVKDTAYGLDAAASAASQLAASGVDFKKTLDTVNGEDLTAMHKSLRAISGVAAMTNSSYEDIARIFTTVAGNGRLMGDQLLQLSSRGMNAAAKLAEVMNTTEEEVRTMVSKGQIDFQTFAFAMDNAFGEHAKEANKTFTGALGNMKAALSRVGEIFASPIINKTNTLFISLTERIDEFKNKLKSIKVPRTLEEIKKQYGDISMNAAAYEQILKGMGERTVTFGDHFAEMWQSGIDAFSAMVKAVDISWFDKIVEKVDSVTVKITEFFNLIKEVYSESAEEAADGIEDSTKTLLVSAKEAQAAKDIILKGMYGSGQQRIDALTEMFGGGDDGKQHAKNVQAYVDSVISAGWDFDKAAIKVEDAAEKAGKAQGRMAKDVKKAKIKAVIDDITGSISNLWNTAKNLGKAATKIGSAILKAFAPFFKIELGDVTGSAEKFTEVIEKISEKLIISDKSAEKITSTITNIIDKIKEATELVKKANTKVKNLFDSIKNSGVATTVKSMMSNMVHSITEAFNGKSLKDSIKGAVSTASDSISNLFKIGKDPKDSNAAVQQVNNVTQAVSGKKGLSSALESLKKIKLPKVNLDKVKKFVEDILGIVRSLTLKDAARISFATYNTTSVIKFMSSIRNISKISNNVAAGIKSAKKVPEAISGFFDAMKKTVQTSVKAKLAADVRESNAKAIFALAGALALVAATIVILSAMDTNKVIAATGTMALLMVLLTFMVNNITQNGAKIAEGMGGMKQFVPIVASLVLLVGAMTASLFSLTIAARILATADTDSLLSATATMLIITGTFISGIIALLKATEKMSPKHILSVAFGLSMIFTTLTGLMLSVAASLFVMKHVQNVEKLLALLLGFIALITFVVYEFLKHTDKLDSSITSRALILSGSIVAISVAVLIISRAIKKVSNVQNVEQIAITLMVCLISIGTMLWLLADRLLERKDAGLNKRMITFAASVIMITLAMNLIAKAMHKVKDVSNIESVALALTGALGAIGIMIGVFKKMSDKDKYDRSLPQRLTAFSSGVIMIAQAMVMIANAFKIAGQTSGLETTAFTMLASLGVIELIMISFLKFTDKYDSSIVQRISVMTGAIIGISAAMLIIAVSMRIAGKSENIIASGLIMIGILAVIGAVLATFGYITKKYSSSAVAEKIGALSTAFVAIAAAMLMISLAMAVVSKIPDLGAAMLAVGGMIALIILALGTFAMLNAKNDKASSALLSLSAAFIVIALSLSILANAIAKLSGMQSGLLAAAIGFGIFAAVLIGLSIAAAALPMFAKGLEAVGKVFLYAGAGALLLGAGMYLLFTGIGKVTMFIPLLSDGLERLFTVLEEHKEAAIAIGIVIAVLLAATVYGIIKLMPVISKVVDTIANAFKAIGSMLSSGTSKFKTWMSNLSTKGKVAAVTLITTLCAAILKAGPTLFDTIGQLILKLLSYLGSIAGALALGLLDFLIKVINGLADAIMVNSARIAAALWGVVIALADVLWNIIGELVAMVVGGFSDSAASKVREFFSGTSDELMTIAHEQRKLAEEADQAKRDYVTSQEGFALSTESAAGRSGNALSKLSGIIKKETGDQTSDLDALKEQYNDLPGYAYDAILRSQQATKGESLFGGLVDGDASDLSSMMSNTGDLFDSSEIDLAGDYGEAVGTEYTDEAAITVAEGADEMYDASDDMMGGAQDAIVDNKEETKKNIQSNFNDPAQAQVRGSRPGMYSAASYVVEGAIEAIEDGKKGYSAAMVNLAKAGQKSFETQEEIESPSKVFFQNGEYIVQGLINGIVQSTDGVTSTMGGLSNAILLAFGDPFDYLSKISSGELVYDPSIRPVFDGSSIRTGADSINSMLRNQTVSVSGFSGKLAADISSLDHTNSDVVGELRALREDMSYMQEAISNMQIVMDTGALVGSTVDAYDEAFGRRAVYGRRGN